MHASIKNVAMALGLAGLSQAQTFSSCNPVRGDKCSPNPAFGGEESLDLDRAAQISDVEGFFTVDGGVKYDTEYNQLAFGGGNGMQMSIFEEKHAPTLYSKDFLFFGHVEVELRAAPGNGIVTSVVLQSDTLDEIDWEWVGAEHSTVQSNIFYQGVENYNFGGKHELGFDATAEFHTYSIDWTPEKLTWSVDGNVIREHLPDTGVFPQTPCQLRLGTWVAGKGDYATESGRIDWAGGMAQWDQAPFNAFYRRIKIVDYAGGYNAATTYEYTSDKGTWDTIKVTGGGKKVGFPDGSVFLEDDSEAQSSSSAVESTSSVTKTKASTTAAPTKSAASSEASSEASSSAESSFKTTIVTTTTDGPASNPTQDAAETSAPPSAASGLQRGGLFLGVALLAGALLM